MEKCRIPQKAIENIFKRFEGVELKWNENLMIHIPFNIDIDPMERLLLVNFENDPDTLIYR